MQEFFSKRRFVIKESGNEFMGELLLLTRNSNIKIFDYTQRKVLSIVSNIEKQIEAYQHFKQYFNIPTIEKYDKSKSIIIEPLISYSPIYSLSEEIILSNIQQIFKDQSNYYKSNSITKTHTSYFAYMYSNIKKRVEKKSILHKIYSDIKDFEVIKSTLLVNTHGDLCLKNILICNDTYFVIDWEYSGYYTVLYDFFNLICVEVFDNENFNYVEKYMQGYFDNVILTITSIFGSKFDPQQRELYVKAYLIERAFMRDRTKTKRQLKVVDSKYRRLVEVLEGEKNNENRNRVCKRRNFQNAP